MDNSSPKLIVEVDRGNILRGPVAAYISNRILQEKGLSNNYRIISRRTQGVDPDDPFPPEFKNIFEYFSETRSILVSRKNEFLNFPGGWTETEFRNLKQYGSIKNNIASWLIENGIDLTDHKSTPIDAETALKASSMFAMDVKTFSSLQKLFPQQSQKIHLLSEINGWKDDINDPEHAQDDEQIYILETISKVISDGFTKMIRITEESHLKSQELQDGGWESLSGRRPEY